MRQEYSLVRGLVAVVEAIRSRQRREAGWRWEEAVVVCHVLFSVVRDEEERTSKWNRKWRHKYFIWSGGTSSMQLGESATQVSLVTAWRNAVGGTAAAAVNILIRRIGERGSNPSANHGVRWTLKSRGGAPLPPTPLAADPMQCQLLLQTQDCTWVFLRRLQGDTLLLLNPPITRLTITNRKFLGEAMGRSGMK